jgi:hypothetical protein
VKGGSADEHRPQQLHTAFPVSDDCPMFRVGLFFVLLNLAVLVVALIDCLSTDVYEIRNLPRLAWVLLIILFSPIGGIAWYFAGRPVKVTAGHEGWRPGGGLAPTSRPRPVAPDDDPEFLRHLNETTRNETTKRDEMDMLRRWEEDLKRREDDEANPEKPTEKPTEEPTEKPKPTDDNGG